MANLATLRCPSCGDALDVAATDLGAVQVRCAQCGGESPVLGLAALAWARGSISRDDFLSFVSSVIGDDVESALTALAVAASWWEARPGPPRPSEPQ